MAVSFRKLTAVILCKIKFTFLSLMPKKRKKMIIVPGQLLDLIRAKQKLLPRSTLTGSIK